MEISHILRYYCQIMDDDFDGVKKSFAKLQTLIVFAKRNKEIYYSYRMVCNSFEL